MKPEIIFISEKDGLITLRKEDIITLVDKVYEAGKEDAQLGSRKEGEADE